MFSNYVTTAINSLLKNKLFSAINILGLAVGLTACILLGLYVRNELSYDRYHADAERIYRISRDYYAQGGSPELLLATNAPLAGPLLREDFSEVEDATRIYRGFTMLVSHDEIAYYEDFIRFADSNVFNFFAMDWVQGSPALALTEPGSIVLTESMAARHFGVADPLGQVLNFTSGLALKVTGIVRDLPGNTHLKADAFASLAALFSVTSPAFSQEWSSNNYYTYVKLVPGANIDDLAAQFPAFLQRHGASGEVATGMRAQALTDIQLHSSNLQLPMKPTGDIGRVFTFIAVALCILLIACINFMNLATARSAQRAKEVGMRKAIGASRGEIISQFLGESLISVFIAMALAIASVELLLAPFNAFVGNALDFQYLTDPLVFLPLLAVGVVVGLLSGSYPAFFLSSFRSAQVLRGDVSRTAGLLFRNILVVFQFAVAVILVIATLVIYSQVKFAKNIDLGFNNEQVLVINNLGARWDTLRNTLLAHPEITSVTASNITPGVNNLDSKIVRGEEGNPSGQGMQNMFVDYDFFKTYEIDILAGRDFAPDRPADRLIFPTEDGTSNSGGFILSEMAVRQFGWTPDTAPGKWFELALSDGFTQSIRGQVIGVVADIHFEAVQAPIEPIVYMLPPTLIYGNPAFSSASLRLSGRNLQDTLDFIDDSWKTLYPDRPIRRSFIDQTFQALYLQEERQGKLFTYFAVLAIVVASMGLFGLASFNAERRTKEIGVRKVMGGSVWSIVLLLTNDFSKLVLLSNLIAWPVAYFAMERWLQNFAYRIDLTPLIFVGSGLIALCIAWVTVGGTAANAASQKPALALRYE